MVTTNVIVVMTIANLVIDDVPFTTSMINNRNFTASVTDIVAKTSLNKQLVTLPLT